jgi:oligopeptidase B
MLTIIHSLFAGAEDIKPPVAEIIPKLDIMQDEQRTDNYFWLRDKSNPKVIEYLEAENRYTEAVMKHTEPFQEQLYQELLGRIKETDLTVPEKLDDYFYYTRTETGKQYRIYCRKQGSLDAAEEILLDGNALAEGHDYMAIGAYEVSPNHQLLAYAINTTGDEKFTLRVKDLSTGELLPDEVPNIYYGVEWANDNQTLFYTTLDDTKRPYKLHRHKLGSDSQEDALVYHETDESFYLHLGKTRSNAYLLMNLESNNTSEVHYLEADDPTGDFKVFQPRRREVEYSVEHHSDRFLIVTNVDAKNFKLIEAPVDAPSEANWKEVISHREAVKLDGVSPFQNHLVVYERENGLKQIRIFELATNEVHSVDFPEPVYTFWGGGNREFNTNILRFHYSSFITPNSVFDYNMDAKTRELKKQEEVLGEYDPSRYESQRIFAEAADGTEVPVSLVYKKGMTQDGNNPLLLIGYGSYGISIDPNFASNGLSLLDRGFIVAIAHIRGGGEMGRPWYESGKLLNKKSTFTDFITCAEHLIAENYTTSDKLVIQGGSAGGLLMGAVMNIRPELFKAVLAHVPFVDALNTMLDASIPLTVIEYEEWGNPNEKPYYDYIRSYSPYDNIEAKNYPNLLVTAGLNDPRVHYWEPAKWTAKLRASKTDSNRILLKTEMGSGHGGPSGRYDALKETAFEYAFILDVLGIEA